MASIYIVEDEATIRGRIAEALAADGHSVRAAGTAMEALSEIVKVRPDLVILDLGLPDLDGADLLGMIRSIDDVLILVATARDDEREIVRLLDAGADEYVVKPYSADEIRARVGALIRRFGATADVLRFGELAIHVDKRMVELNGEQIELSRKEFEILLCLAQTPDHVVTREELFAQVWRQPYGGVDKTIDVHVSWLRRKLGESASSPRFLHTVRGVGFRLASTAA